MREIRVECYSGYRADERPLRFTLGERRYEVIVHARPMVFARSFLVSRSRR